MFDVAQYKQDDPIPCPLHPNEILYPVNYYGKDSVWSRYECPITERTINLTASEGGAYKHNQHPDYSGIYIEIQSTNWNKVFDPDYQDVMLAYYLQIVWDGKQWVARNRHEETGIFEPEVFWVAPPVYPEIEALHELQEALQC